MTETQIKDYLKKYRIDSEESLAKHIEELKRNTKPNNEIIFTLVDLLLNEKSVLLSFFRENSKERGETVTKTTTPFFLDEAVISYQSFENGITKDNTVTYTSTRHKSQAGETHKEIVGDLEGVNKPKGVEVSLKELKENTINNVELGLDIADILGITLCDNRDYIYKLIEKKISAKKDKIKTAKLHTYPLTPEECFKDDVITNSNRGEKEMMKVFENINPLRDFSEVVGVKESQTAYKEIKGIKESNGKVDYSEINLEILDLMAERFTANKHKYPKGNMKKTIDIKSLEWALFRHVKKMIQPIETDEETYKDHLSAVLCNCSMLCDQLNLQKKLKLCQK